MKRLAVFVHFDSTGEVAPHVQHTLREVQSVADHLVVVTTAKLTDPARETLRCFGELIERENVGYDFMSYKVGLDSVDLDDFDEAFIINDSCVGPVIPLLDIFEQMADQPFDVWGMTMSREISQHIQSYFVVFRRSALSHPVVRNFWAQMKVLNGREEVIESYEIGMSRAMIAAGLRLGAYFEPTRSERALSKWRLIRVQYIISSLWHFRMRLRHPLPMVSIKYNPTASLADLVLRGGRLPVVKLSTLRQDPYRLGADQLLRLCENEFPDAFVGVRSYLMRYSDYRESLPHPLRGTVPPRWRYGYFKMRGLPLKRELN